METLNKEKKNYTGKGAKKMKNLIFLIIVSLIFMPNSIVFADFVSGRQYTIIEVHNIFNAFGDVINGTQTTTTTTIKKDSNDKETISVNKQTSTSTWKGGSLKFDSVIGTVDTTNPDDSTGTTTYHTDYHYTVEGKLDTVTGGAHSESARFDKDGKKIGHNVSDTTDTYEVRDGQALKMSSHSTGTNYDGDKVVVVGRSVGDTVNEYTQRGGNWVLTKEIDTNRNNEADNSFDSITKVKIYTRDPNGTISGISQTMSGSRSATTGIGEDNKPTTTTYTFEDKGSIFIANPQLGWLLVDEKYTWREIPVDITPPVS